MRNNQHGFTLPELLFTGWIVIILGGIVGWIINLVWLIQNVGGDVQVIEWTLMIILRVVGVILGPLGSIMGWIGLFF